jgi:dipeptidyl aminopeptidase/acylaminoacyl peptidase
MAMASEFVSVLFGVLAVALSLDAAFAAEPGPAWPGDAWNAKLGKPYEEWKPIRDVLVDLAGRAGVTKVTFAEEPKGDFIVPLPAELTVREALQKAAAIYAFEATWEGGGVTIRRAAKAASWTTVLPADIRPVAVGEYRGSVYLPRDRQGQGPIPWVWYAPHGPGPANAWMMKRLLESGIAVAAVNVGESAGHPAGRAGFQAFYEKIVKDFGLTKRAVLLPQSRGGLMLYNWAVEHPDLVAAVGGIYTVCDLRSYPGLKKAAEAYGLSEADLEKALPQHNPIERLAPLAKAGVAIFHIHGDKDGTVPVEKNAGELVKRYQALGGPAKIEIVPGGGHEVTARFFQHQGMVDFLTTRALAEAAKQGGAAAAGAGK